MLRFGYGGVRGKNIPGVALAAGSGPTPKWERRERLLFLLGDFFFSLRGDGGG